MAILKNSVFFNRPFWILFSKKNCFIPMKISHKLCFSMDGTQFWCFLWFPANSLLCVILRYTVYIRKYGMRNWGSLCSLEKKVVFISLMSKSCNIQPKKPYFSLLWITVWCDLVCSLRDLWYLSQWAKMFSEEAFLYLSFFFMKIYKKHFQNTGRVKFS